MTATTSNTNIKTDNTPKEATSTIASQDVGLLFVREYYTFLNKKPHRLHAFYNKDSYFIRGDEGENVPTFQGQEEIRKKIEELNFEDCKVLVTQVDSQVSANDGILIQVLGEMCVMDGPSQKFSQTFFLAPQPNGYYVLNDIFRFLKDEVDIDYYTCEDDQQPQSQNKKEAVPEQPQEQEPEQQQPVNELITKQPEQELVKEEQQQQKVEEHKEKEIIEEPKSKSSDEKKKKQNQNKDEVKVNGTVDHSSSSNEKASTETSSPATTTTTPSAAAAAAPAAPTKPAAPKTWANVTANDSTRWGPQASEAKGSVSPVTTTSNAATPKESTPQQSQQQPSAQPQQPQQQQPQQQQPQQQQQQPQQQPQQQQPQQQSQQQSNQPNKDQRKDEVTNIFVKNVYSNVNQDQLHEAFSKFGPIKTLNIVQSRNCAFVDFTTPEACQKALAQHKVTVGSHTVLAEERRQHGGRYGGNRQQQNGSGGNYRHQQGNYRRNTGSGSGGGNSSGRAGGNSGNKSRSGSGNQK